MRLLRFGSIRCKLLAAFLVVFLPLNIFTITSYSQGLDTRLKLIRTTEVRTATAVASSLDFFLKERIWTNMQALDWGDATLDDALDRCVETIKDGSRYVRSVAIFDANSGRLLACCGKHSDTQSLSLQEIPSGEFNVSGVCLDNDGTPHFFLDNRIAFAGETEVLIRAEYSVDAIAEVAESVFSSGSQLVVVDSEARILHASSEQGFTCGETMNAESICSDAIIGDVRSELSGWKVMSIADSALRQAAYEKRKFRLVGTLLISLAGLLLVLWFGNVTASRLQKLGRGASALAVGDLRKRFHVESGDEVEELATALNLMAENIEKREKDITRLSTALEGLFKIARAAASSLDLDEVLRSLTHATADVLSAKACAIYLFDSDGLLAIHESYNLSPEFVQNTRLAVGERWTGVAVQNRHWLTATELVNDPEFRYREQVAQEGLHCLLSAPLIAGSTVLGAITVWTEESRHFSPLDIHVLTATADHAASVIQNAKLYGRESRIAETLQSTFMGRLPSQIGPLRFGVKYISALEEAKIGGDLFDVFPLPDGQVAVVVADVSGKGLKAAMHTAMAKFILKAYTFESPEDPGRAMEKLNNAMAQDESLQVFITVILAIIDPERETVSLANAGHPPGILLTPDGKQQTLIYKTGIPVACTRNAIYGTKQMAFPLGSRLFLYTDGIIEARIDGVEFGMERLEAALFDTWGEPVQNAVDTICTQVQEFTGDVISDDIVIVAVDMLPVSEPEQEQQETPESDESCLFVTEPEVRVALRGELDLQYAHILAETLASAMRYANEAVTIDMSHVTFISSSAINALALAQLAAATRGGSFILHGIRPHVKKTLQMSGFGSLFGLPPLSVPADKGSKQNVQALMRNTDWRITESVASSEKLMVRKLRNLAVSVARDNKIDDDAISDIRLMAEESLAMAVAESTDPNIRVCIRCLSAPSAFIIEVIYQGTLTDFSSELPEAPASVDVEDIRIQLIRNVSDENYCIEEENGNRLRLVKWL